MSRLKKIIFVSLVGCFFLFFFIVKTSQSQTCDPECCGKPNGYVYNQYLNEFCDPNYKNGRWIIIEGVCWNGKKKEQRGCATCDPCTPGVPRTSPPNLEKNECTPGGCGETTPFPQEKKTVTPNFLFIVNQGSKPIKLETLIIGSRQLSISSIIKKGQVFPFDYSQSCNFFQNQLKSSLNFYLGYFKADPKIEHFVKGQGYCQGNGIISIE